MYSAKQLEVLTAARGIFLRFGYKRVTMKDLATAAGISRPGLYLTFQSKEEVFIGVMRQESAAMFEEIRTRLRTKGTVIEKLRYALEVWTVRPFEMIRHSAEARELLECEFDFAQVVAADSNAEFESILEAILEDGPVRLPNGLSPQKAAHLLRCAAYGFKRQALNVSDLKVVISELLMLLAERTTKRSR